ncbi:MAG: sialate O-acetylesterase [Halobacteriaceae archaeon]
MDVFLVAGQSNARGKGESADAPPVPEGVAHEWRGDGLVHLEDPVGDDHGPDTPVGSAWPAFAVTYHELTGRESVYVPAAVGGSGLVAAANPDEHWDVERGSALFRRAVQRTWDCLTHLRADGDPTLRGVLWGQGERDAQAIDAGEVAVPEYRGALRRLVGGFRREFDRADLPVFVFQTGRPASGDTDGFAAVRDAQARLADSDDAVHLVFDGAVGFPERGLMRDDLHYTQGGYNEMGRVGAEGVVAALQG